MRISKDTVVSLSYELRLNAEDGDVIEQVSADSPLTFLYGAGNMLPKFEEKLEGFEEGQDFNFSIESEEAYGERNEDAVIDLPKNIFEVDGEIDENLLKIGNVIPMKDPEGNEYQGIVQEVKDEEVKMDFNHPLAGEKLHFNGKVEDLREASEEEINNGQAQKE